MNNEFYIQLLVNFYWSFAVVTFSIIASFREIEYSPYQAFAASILWPFTVLIGFAIVLYQIPFKTVKQIRIDLQNRKVMKEFQIFLDERNKAEQAVLLSKKDEE